MSTELGYAESSANLKTRIESHKRFSNFSLEEWLEKNLSAKEGDVLLDLGCGNGNFFACYSKKLGRKGVIVGIDKNADLLKEARCHRLDTPFILLEWNMNKPLPFTGENFDIREVLRKSGQVFLVGPTDNNAKELYEFNKKVFNIDRSEKVIRRTNRLEKELYPELKEIFGNVSREIIPSKLSFSGRADFIKYYMATLLFKESCAKSGFKPSYKELLGVNVASYDISKEMIVLKSKKI